MQKTPLISADQLSKRSGPLLLTRMSGLTIVPKPHIENICALADFAEIECLRRADRRVSNLDIFRIIQREGDIGDRLNEDNVHQRVSEAFEELAARQGHCGSNDGRYPYEVLNNGALVQLKSQVSSDGPPSTLYFYLLLATRMNMRSERKQAGEDATVLFEELSSEVAIRFWGGPNANVKALVFGTGRLTENIRDNDDIDKKGFVAAVNHLCKELGEGYKFESHPDSRVTAKDGKLDIVVWRSFADNRGAQLIGFGQCKTGTYWHDDLTKLQPEGFCGKWMFKSPAVLPVRLYFVADRVIDRWYDTCKDGGILFDRCRVVEHSNGLPAPLLSRIDSWVRAAAVSQGLNLP